MKTKRTFRDLYKFPGFRARSTLKPHPEDPEGCIVTLERRQKKLFVPAVAHRHQDIVIGGLILCETWMPEQPVSILNSSIAGLPVRIVTP
ncbi:MAG: hypothetical protein ABFD66_07505 [Smithella sp.]